MSKSSAPIVKQAVGSMAMPSREKGQRSRDLPSYFLRLLPQWITPDWVMAERWRAIVRNQPFAMICRETIIDHILALDWKIEVRDSTQREERKSEVEYYTNLFTTGNGGYAYSEIVEWICQDYLDLPFGGAAEVGREGDDENGKLLWVIPLDGATLFPTLQASHPVAQRIEGFDIDPVYFPKHAIDRLYMSPRPEMRREGWGMAPPEKIFLALQMLSRGDVYYANLLLDVPEIGILDLGDMERTAAEDWVASFSNLLGGTDPFKIPVLYEHTSDAKFIPFAKNPNDITFDRITIQKAAIMAAGYGVTLSDVGFPQGSSGGDTLAGSIRSERKSRRTGFALAKRKLTEFFDRLLPSYLKWSFIDVDDELSVSMGRARVSNATAFGQLIDKRIATPKECRLQMIADGMFTISMPEDPDESEFDVLPDPVAAGNSTPERPGLLGNPQPPSTGGHGEASAMIGKAAYEDRFQQTLKRAFSGLEADATDARLFRLIKIIAPSIFTQIRSVVNELSTTQEINMWVERANGDDSLYGDAKDELEKGDDKEDEWWLLNINDEELVILLAAAYRSFLEEETRQMIFDLYVDGYLDSPLLQAEFKLTNEAVLRSLSQQAANMIRNVNEGTKYYLRQVLVRGIREGLTQEDIIQKIREGLDIQEILSDNDVMQELSQIVLRELAQVSEYRIRAIVSYELSVAENRAKVDQYKRIGLKQKAWQHFGSDTPCDICQENISAGYVPLDYQFRSAFGTADAPAAHPYDHCGITYNRVELADLAQSGNLYVWTGD